MKISSETMQQLINRPTWSMACTESVNNK